MYPFNCSTKIQNLLHSHHKVTTLFTFILSLYHDKIKILLIIRCLHQRPLLNEVKKIKICSALSTTKKKQRLADYRFASLCFFLLTKFIMCQLSQTGRSNHTAKSEERSVFTIAYTRKNTYQLAMLIEYFHFAIRQFMMILYLDSLCNQHVT